MDTSDFQKVMGFAPNEVIYEDDLEDTSIPDVQKITKRNNILPLHGSDTTMNLNALVYQNIIQSTYYKNFLNEITTFQQVVDEVYYNVSHLEPWERGTRRVQGSGRSGGVRGVGAGGVISTAFCLLHKLFTLRVTRKQLVSMINSTQSVYLRGMGFLYIRYTQPPADLWAWFSPYLDDEEEVDPRSGGGDLMSIGQLMRTLLNKLEWYGTLFPRIPVPIQKDIDQKLREHGRSYQDEHEHDKIRSKHHDHRDYDDSRKRHHHEDDYKVNRNAPPPSRCHHHLRHHHCRKHRRRCPTKAKKARLENDGKHEKETDVEKVKSTES